MTISNFHTPTRHRDLANDCDCAGRVVTAEFSGVRFFFCDRCDAYSTALENFPSSTDRAANHDCWEAGDHRSLDKLS